LAEQQHVDGASLASDAPRIAETGAARPSLISRVRNAMQAASKNQFSFLKSNLVGRLALRLISVVTHLSIQGEGENSQISSRRTAMTTFKILGAAAILPLMFATPVFAQAAIQEPGAFAFYYPNNDVLNGGRPTPAAGLDARTPLLFGRGGPAMDTSANGASCAERYRSYDPSSGTFLGYDGRRHACE
jgi:hypothetical protein